METYHLPHDLKVFGFRVTNFPAGIEKAFESLLKIIPGGFDRPYYGIAYMDKNEKMIYKATALEKSEGEAEKYNLERSQIEKGEYLAITIYGWRKKTDSINKVFQEIMADNRVNKTKPCVEWYRNDDEMMCMMQTLH